MSANHNRISKSQFLKGLQCPKALWLYRNRPDLTPKLQETKNQLFDSGHEVGILAQKYFEGGVELTTEYYEIDKAISSTTNHIRNGTEIIYEAAACSPDGAYSRIDIFRKIKSLNRWDLIEVKQSTEIKNYHLYDIAFQRYVFENAGHSLRNSYLMHINKEYVRFGNLNLQELFKLEDCTGFIGGKDKEIQDILKNLQLTINLKEEPVLGIGGHCSDPFECDYSNYCWLHIPEYSVYNLFKGNKLERLLEQNIIQIAEVPENFECTDRQYIDISSYRHQNININKQGIREFLSSLKYPLYFLDYETIYPPIPLFDNSRPYQQIPFQFSLHVQEKPAGDIKHFQFLHTQASDPRPEFVKTLVNTCNGNGSVVVYNQAFESRINNELGATFPEYNDALQKINGRMRDLLIPFRSRSLYHPAMKGSASLKAVLPAFVPELSYAGMEIGNGETASMMYMMCIRNLVPPEEKGRIYNHLLEYCHLDTLAEVRLLDVLIAYSR